MDSALTQHGNAWIDAINELDKRLKAVEVVTRLLARPIMEYLVLIDNKTLKDWLVDKVDNPPDMDYTKRWTKNYDNVFAHSGADVSFKLPDNAWGDKDKRALVRALLIIAAVEEMTPVQLVNEIRPGTIHVIDALADIADD